MLDASHSFQSALWWRKAPYLTYIVYVVASWETGTWFFSPCNMWHTAQSFHTAARVAKGSDNVCVYESDSYVESGRVPVYTSNDIIRSPLARLDLYNELNL